MPLRPSHASWKVAASRDQFRAEQACRRRRRDSRPVPCCSRSARRASARTFGGVNAMHHRKQIDKTKPHPLTGTWVNGDEYATEVEYQVSAVGQGFTVRAVDRYDGEEAEVYDVKWDGEALSFATHWPFTGRFVKCR